MYTIKQTLCIGALAMSLAGCAAPTLQQRQDNWRKFRDVTRAECVIGRADPAMPADVRDWCMVVIGP